MNFVVSLEDALIRRDHIRTEFSKNEVGFKFFNAVNASNLKNHQEQLGVFFEDELFSIGEKACFLSHVALWEYCINTKLDYIVIFEDDVFLSSNSNLYLNELSWIPKGVDLIKFEKFEDSPLMSLKTIKLKHDSHLRLLEERHLGTAGYILSKSGAIKLLNLVKKDKQKLKLDELIFNENIKSKYMNIYQFCPALVIQADRIDSSKLPSQLEDERSKNKIVKMKVRRNILDKVMIEFNRLIVQFKRLFCRLKINLN